ncbi:L-rhamnose isomerase [Niveibacterium terrae]|uniref:L-rhamnose isomerase n=1 Tax=Niveibacterium terrae TaxID=3373598 RepID=UPI003A8D8055
MNTSTAYNEARTRFAEIGIDTEAALTALDAIPVSMHCWQGDDVVGFEFPDVALSGGIQTTGNYPGKAHTAEELRSDAEAAMALIPGRKRFNLHALYIDSDEKVSRDKIEPKHFERWVAWAKSRGLGLDFNPSCFSHPKFVDGMTLAHPDPAIRRFWIDHCIASRRISDYFGQELGTKSVMNIWIPDGMKDQPADRLAPRQRLLDALDEIMSANVPAAHHLVAVEGKLFGIGAESYTVGSNEFYMAYAVSRKTALCLDAGHFHPTEVVSDKISAVEPFVQDLLLHVTRSVRWDSDHVVTLDDETQAIASEIVRNGLLGRVHIGLDFFDASINRIAAWVIGMRNMKKALLRALLEPTETLRRAEAELDFTTRFALFEELKSMPWSAVWDQYCERQGVGIGAEWLATVKKYEAEVLVKRR